MALNFATNNSLSSITALPASISGGGLNLISTQTASSSSTISFTSGIDSTYKEYIFKFIDIHLATDGAEFEFQADIGTDTNYNVTLTSSYFLAEHNEADSSTGFSFQAARDQAQGTAFQHFGVDVGADNDHCIAGFLHFYDPASTTKVKHFIGVMQQAHQNDLSLVGHLGGYFNTTTALTRVRFKASSGNVDAGTIKLYGIT